MDDRDSESGALRILVSAAYPALRAGLRALLEASPGLHVVGEFATVSEGAEVGFRAADILVADVEDESAVAAVAELAEGMGVVYLATDAVLFRALERQDPRPRALLLQGATAEELGAAVTAVANGLIVTDPAVAAALRDERPGAPYQRASGPAATPLSAREVGVLTLVAAGLPNKTIALRLGISDHTVKFHVGSILGKLGAASRSEAVALAVRSGQLPL